MTGTLSRQSLAELVELVGERLGLSFPSERWEELEKKVRLAAHDLGCQDLEAFARLAQSGQVRAGGLESLACHLTIGETYFYRDARSLEALEHHVLPAILRAGENGPRRLRVWSAGCASGEEPYTVAMMVNDDSRFNGWNVTIVGSDINQSLLARAEAGRYSEWSFRGVPDVIRARYFHQVGKSSFQIHPSVRKMVSFEYLNLVGDEYPSLFSLTNAMDVILCRNVLMYFKPAIIQRVVGKLQRSLRDGGWLVVSPVELPLVTDAALSAVQFPDAVLHCKHASPANPPPAGDAAPGRTSTGRKPRPRSGPTPRPPSPATSPATSSYARALEYYAAAQYDACVSLLADPASGLGEDPKAHELLARAHANAGRLADAELWCERAIRADKLNARLRYLLATVLIEQDRLERAAAALHRAIYLDQQFVVAHFALGQLMLRMGSMGRARGSFINASTLLESRGSEEQVPDADGLSAGRFYEIVQSLLRERVKT